MNLRKLVPWNWFKDEEKEGNSQVAVPHVGQNKPTGQLSYPVNQFYRDMNDILGRFLYGYGMPPHASGNIFQGSLGDGLLKPMVDVNASDKEYSISIEVPGIDQKDIKLEISNNTLTVRGEKQQKKEEKEKNYYRMERSYGAFQRLLSLPEDADQDKAAADFKNGVLTVTVPRKALPDKDTRQIQIR